MHKSPQHEIDHTLENLTQKLQSNLNGVPNNAVLLDCMFLIHQYSRQTGSAARAMNAMTAVIAALTLGGVFFAGYPILQGLNKPSQGQQEQSEHGQYSQPDKTVE